MKRSDLEEYLNKKVTVVMSDGKEINGILKRCDDPKYKNDINISYNGRKWYFVENNDISRLVFRTSHVKKIKG